MDDNNLDRDTLEYYVEFVSNMSTTEKAQDTDDHNEILAVEGPARPTISNSLCEKRNDALCQEYWFKLDEADSPYLPDQ